MKKLFVMTLSVITITSCTQKTDSDVKVSPVQTPAINVAQTPPPAPKSKCEIAMDVVPTFNAEQSNAQQIFDFYKQYKDCMDGMIAETMADTVTKTLSQKWTELEQLAAFIKEDPNFKPFVLSHIDSLVTGNTSQVEQILQNATKQCPHAHTKLCSEIKKVAQTSLKSE